MAKALPEYRKINFDTIVEAGETVMQKIKGSYSALFLTAGKTKPYLMAMTDPYKIRQLVMGKKAGAWYFAS